MIRALIAVAVAYAIHAGLACYLASGEVLTAILVRQQGSTGLALVALFAVRAFLLWVAPAWLLYAGLGSGWRAWQRRRGRAVNPG